MSDDSAAFRLADDLIVVVDGHGPAVAQFDREYGLARVRHAGPGAGVAVTVTFGPLDGATPSLSARHKTVRWDIALSAPQAEPLTARVAIGGAPPAFARSLVQGYVVEPLISLAAARRGRVLLPGAAVQEERGALLIIGRSGAGKSTLMARAAAAGRTVLGDDQVLVSPRDGCRPFPRRMRFYADLRLTAPAAFGRLGRRRRAALRARGAVAAATRGYVAPSLPVGVDAIGRAPALASIPLARVVVVERSASASDLTDTELAPASAAEASVPVLHEQRSRLAAAAGPWPAALARVEHEEAELLRSAFEQVPCRRVVVPERLAAPDAIDALARHLGLAG